MAIVVRTPKANVRSWTREDAEPLVRCANNWNVARHLRDRFPHPYTEDDAREWLATQVDREPETTFAIEVDGAFGGAIGLHLGDDVERHTAEVGYWLAEPLWGRGIMSEIVGPFTDWAFGAFDLYRIEAGVFSGNPASERVLVKAGYELEGRHRNAVVKDGRVLDRLMYARLSDAEGSGRGAVR